MISATLSSFRRWRPLLDGLAADIHPLRWSAAGIGGGAAARLGANPRARRLLSLDLGWAAVETTSPWPDWTAWEGADPAALRPGPELERCSLRLGAVLFRGDVAKLVFGRDVAAFKSAAGEDAYFFALRQAVLAREAAGLPPERIGAGGLPDRVVRASRLSLAIWLGSLPGSLASRVALKLPPSVDACAGEVAAWPEGEREGWRTALAGIFSLTFGRA